MGVVYRARDRTIGRIVALKVLRPELIDDRARLRFLREARAAGRVEHDHVVRVYATSEPSDQVLYLAMEYLGGPSLAGLLKSRDRGWLGPREAAGIMMEAALGVAAAHASGLVHRDVKPDNILIDPVTGRAKVGDFGLARLDASGPDLTREGVIAGTPGYLSPEQARGDPDVGPLADVYALGVTLYECLAGEPPFRGTPHRIIHQILEDDPRPPRIINEAIPRDLETVCLKAMAREPGLRYAGAAELAADLRRWLAGEPIQARRIGPGGKVWRLARRYPRVSALLAALVLTLAGGVAGIAWQWRRADANARRSLDASLRAEHSYRDARDAVDRFYTRMLVSKVLDKPGLEQTRAEVVHSMLDYYREFLRQRGDDAALRADAAKAGFRIGYLSQNQGDKRVALAPLAEARRLYEALVRERPHDVKVGHDFVACLGLIGHLLSELGRNEEALEANRASCDIQRKLINLEPEDPESRRRLGAALGNLANSYLRSGKFDLALSTYRLALEQQEIQIRLYPDKPDDRSYLAMTLHNMSFVLNSNSPERVLTLEKALAIRRGLASAASPRNPYFERNVARTLTSLGSFGAMNRGKYAEALAMFDEACGIMRRIVQDDPVRLTYRRELVEAIGVRMEALVKLGRPREALDSSKEGFALLADLARADPEDAIARSTLAGLQGTTAAAHEALGECDEALRVRKARLENLQKLVAANPDEPNRCEKLAAETEAIRRLSAALARQ
jgi:serine/threonine protein kinase